MNGTGSHLPLLVEVASRSSGDWLELGCGDFSTPILHGLARLRPGTSLVSADNAPEWLAKFDRLATPWHSLVAVDDWAKMLDLWASRRWGLVFIDHWPGELRGLAFAKLAGCADVIMAHDTEPGELDNYRWRAFVGDGSPFKYRADLRNVTGPWASAFSDVHPWVAELTA